MTIYSLGLHPRSDVHRLYLRRNCGGRGLLNVKHVVTTDECQALSHYILSHSDQPLLKAVQSSGLFKQPECSLSEFKSKWLHDYLLQWKGKPPHGQFPSQVEALTTVDCAYKWLVISGLKIETEPLLCAAQDQFLTTNAGFFLQNVSQCL